MESNDLSIFQTVAQEGNITRAARRLNYVQSNITARIQQLENELQAPLFYRHKRGVTLTPAGETLLDYSNKIVQLLDEASQVIRDSKVPYGRLALGAKSSTEAVKLPAILSSYHKQYPEVDLSLMTGTTEEIIEAVIQYKINGALVAGPVYHPDIIQEPVLEEKLVLITCSAYPKLNLPEDLFKETIIFSRSGCSNRARLEQWLAEEGISPRKTIEFGSLDSIIRGVKEGLGVSVTSKFVIQELGLENEIRCHPLPKKFAHVSTVFIWHKDTFMNNALTSFLELVKQEYQLLKP